MNSTISGTRKCLILFVALLVMATLVVGCKSQPVEKPTISFLDGGYESWWLEMGVAQFIIEKGYGYPTKSLQLSNEVYQAAMKTGEIDVSIEEWPQNYPEWYDNMIKDGYAEELGYILEGGPQFWCIPKWVAEEYNIKTVFDMKDHWELFKDPADPSKGLFINGMIGWDCTKIDEVRMEAYGLTEYYNIMTPGSYGVEAAAMAGAQKKHHPVFGYHWAPTALMGMYDWYILEEPAYDAEVWANILAAKDDPSLRPLDQACAYPENPLTIFVYSGLRQKAPDVVAMFEKMSIGLERCNKALAWAEDNEIKDWEKVAVWFLREYDSHWKTWVTSDAYAKVKKALDEYGPIP